jgi:hypothetical protein
MLYLTDQSRESCTDVHTHTRRLVDYLSHSHAGMVATHEHDTYAQEHIYTEGQEINRWMPSNLRIQVVGLSSYFLGERRTPCGPIHVRPSVCRARGFIFGTRCCATMGPRIALVQERQKVFFDNVAQQWPGITWVQEWPKTQQWPPISLVQKRRDVAWKTSFECQCTAKSTPFQCC